MFEILGRIDEELAVLDRRAVFALLYAAIALTAAFYLRDTSVLSYILKDTVFADVGTFVAQSESNNLAALVWWSFVIAVLYLFIPVAFICFVRRQPLEEYGLGVRLEPGSIKLLLQCVAIMLPLVYLMSLTDSFLIKYPFLKISDGTPYISLKFVVWELIYLFQFFCVEFFFRGFLIHSLKPVLGFYSIFVVTIPYCMIHFGKPPAEALAAIIAGVFLGWLSYRYGTIWIGFFLHGTVAVSMDILALYNKGLLLF